ncbi:MAG TPA: aldose 1-epimerase [Acetobacteraceae bacterium]|jgi:aldose 1-epimerase|nr:aldose 1-epimerase [Acetobacteraceae bacterium]
MLTLRADDMSLTLMPEQGAGILGWTRGGIPLLRHAAPQAVVPGTVGEMACFPLVPYSNRIARGQFTFGGTSHHLALNFGDHPNSIHGVGWQRAWQVIQVAPDATTLSLDHAPDVNWPFAFTAELQAYLMQAALRIELAITNLHGAPAPAGLGLHPFFPRGTATLQFRADAVWQNGPDMIPTARIAIPPDWDHASPRAVGSAALDNCFAGWTGTATLAWPDRTLTLEASEIFRHLVVYTPPGQDFFCVEPVSHMNDAINHATMHVLAPGETLRGTVTFRLS